MVAWGKKSRQFKEVVMREKTASTAFLGLFIVVVSVLPLFAGDSFYGKVTEVKSANLVRLESGQGGYDILIVGIDVPKEGPLAKAATQFVAKLVLGKNARMRLVGRNKNGEMVSRLFTDDPEIGIKDVGLELVRSGLAQRQKSYDYKYHELSQAENEAQKARRGLWATTQPQ
jgi:endonuclease YncB( thermonuclease family)